MCTIFFYNHCSPRTYYYGTAGDVLSPLGWTKESRPLKRGGQGLPIHITIMGLKAPLPALCRSEKEGSHDCLNLLVRTNFYFFRWHRYDGDSGDIHEHGNEPRQQWWQHWGVCCTVTLTGVCSSHLILVLETDCNCDCDYNSNLLSLLLSLSQSQSVSSTSIRCELHTPVSVTVQQTPQCCHHCCRGR